MANFTDAQVAAYIRDNNLSPEQAAQAASAFGVSSSQLASAQNLLSSGAPSVEQASQTYAAQVADRPDLVAQNLAFYNPAAQPDFSTAAPLAGPPAQSATAPVTGALQKATQAEPLYTSLTASSTPQQIAAAYDQYVGMAGGDTQQAQEAAVDYLTKLGVQAPTIEQAYGNFLATNRYEDYLNANPDVKAEFEKFSQRNPNKWTPESYGAYHLLNYGLKEGRAGGNFNEAVDSLTKQILGQNLTGKWTGEGFGSAEANARDMARILAAQGITDINQFGVRDKTFRTEDVYGENDNVVLPGQSYTMPEYYNKATGQAIQSTYDKAQGPIFGGTFAGEGSTGYGVQFVEGKPYFYTQYGGSSNDLAQFMSDPIIGSIIQGAASYFGGPIGTAALNLLAGRDFDDVAKAALVSYVANQVATGVSSNTDVVGALGKSGANIAGRVASAAATGQDPVQALISGGIGLATPEIASLVPGYDDLSAAQKAFVNKAIASTLSDGNLSPQDLANAALSAGKVAAKTSTQGGITNRIYDDTMVQSGADAFLRAKEAGASDEDAYAAAEAVVTPVADVPPSTATITTPQDLGEFAGLDQAIATQKAASTVNIGNAEADTPEEAAALARTRNPDARSFTFGGREYTFGASSADIDRVTREAKLSEIRDAGSFNEAYRLARESKDLLGPDQTFEWRGQKFSTATAEEQKAKEPVFTPTVRDYVANKLADQASDPNFNPQDLSSASLKRYVEAYANANPAQQKAMLESFDGATYGVIDAMLKETAAVNPQGTVVNKAPSTAKEELKAFEKPLISTAIDVVKVAGNLAAADIAGVGTRAAEFVSSVLGGDGETLREVQDLLVNKKDQQMSKLVGNEKAVAAGLASGIESAASFIVGGPVMPVVTIGSVVANNTWQEGATKWIDSKGNAYDSKEEARSYGVTDVRQLTPQENGMRTAAMTAIEVAGEMLGIPGMKQIMKGIPITGSVDKIIDSVKTLGKGLAKEEATELLTTVAQFSTDKFASFGLGQNSTFEDFKGALADTVIATAAAVGGSSAIATSASSVNNAIDRATQGQFDASPIVPAGVNPSEVGSLLERGSDFAKLPADYFLGSNPITQEQADFLKVDKAEQSMMDKIRNQAAGVVLSISAAVSAPAATIDFSAPTQEVTQTIQSELGGKIAGGISTFDAVSQALASGQNANAVISGAISSSISSGQSVESAVTQTVESAINAGAPVSQTVASSVSSAVSSQIASNVPASQAISASIASAVSAVAQESATSATSQSSQAALAIESSVSSAIQSAQQNNVPIDVAIQSAVESAVAAAAVNSISIEQAVQSAVQSAIQTATANNVAQSVAASIAVNAAINTAAANGLNVAQVTQVANATVAGAGPDVGMPTTPESSEEIAAITAPTTPAEPVGAQPAVKTTAAPKAAAPQAVGTAGLAGGMGAMLPSSFEMDETFLPSRETQKAIDPLARVMEAQAELEKTAMMQQIDPRLLSVLQQRIAPEQQQAQQQQFDKDIGALSRLLSGQPANTSDYYSYGSEDSIDSILGGQAANFKEGGYVEPLKAAEGGMALPLLAKSGGALSHYGGREDYKDGKHVAGEGDGQSDDIPAWLADGEFVFSADVVAALGNGSTKAGTDKLYEMMHEIRKRARSTGPKDLPPPALKSPLDYLKSSKRS